MRKARVETKAPRSRWFFRPAKELRLKLRQRFRPNCRNIRVCGFCLSKITKTRTGRLQPASAARLSSAISPEFSVCPRSKLEGTI